MWWEFYRKKIGQNATEFNDCSSDRKRFFHISKMDFGLFNICCYAFLALAQEQQQHRFRWRKQFKSKSNRLVFPAAMFTTNRNNQFSVNNQKNKVSLHKRIVWTFSLRLNFAKWKLSTVCFECVVCEKKIVLFSLFFKIIRLLVKFEFCQHALNMPMHRGKKNVKFSLFNG